MKNGDTSLSRSKTEEDCIAQHRSIMYCFQYSGKRNGQQLRQAQQSHKYINYQRTRILPTEVHSHPIARTLLQNTCQSFENSSRTQKSIPQYRTHHQSQNFVELSQVQKRGKTALME